MQYPQAFIMELGTCCDFLGVSCICLTPRSGRWSGIMNKRNQILNAGLGLWGSGILVGASVIGYRPDVCIGDGNVPGPAITGLGQRTDFAVQQTES